MGYFSDLTSEPLVSYHSEIPMEKQLRWRLEELENRLERLMTEGETGSRVDWDLRRILPRYFGTVADVKAAIALTLEDLGGTA